VFKHLVRLMGLPTLVTGHAGLDGNGVSAFTRTKRIKIELKQENAQQGEGPPHLGELPQQAMAARDMQHEVSEEEHKQQEQQQQQQQQQQHQRQQQQQQQQGDG
jgi:hypothetical protein